MKTVMKKIVVASVVVTLVMAFSSCSKQTCPTYSKAVSTEQGARV